MYNTVIIGAGNIGALFDSPASEEILTHANAYRKHPDFCLKGFYDVDVKRAEDAAGRWGVKAYASLEEAMEYADVVSCTVPDAYHYDILKKLAKYPIQMVFTEKPFTKTVEEAKEICQLYEDRQIPILMNYTRRFVTEFIELRARIGEFGSFVKGIGYYGKGVLHNGSHMIDFLRFLLGEVEVLSGENPIFDFEEDDPSVEARLQVGKGLFCMYPIDCRIATVFELDLFFEKGRIRLTDGCSHVEEYQVRPSDVYEGYYNFKPEREYDVKYDSSFQNALDNSKQHLEQGTALFCNKEDATRVLTICKELQQGGVR